MADDNIELDDLDRNEDPTPAETPSGVGETSFIDPSEDSLLNPRPADTPKVLRRKFKETGRAIGVEIRRYTEEKKSFLRRALKLNVTKKAGPSSRLLLENIELTQTGLKYKGVEVVDKQGIYTNSKFVPEFKKLCKEAQQEYRGTAESVVTEQVETVDEDVIRNVVDESIESLEEYIDDRYERVIENAEELKLSKNIQREIRGVLKGGVFDQNFDGRVDDQLKAMEVDRKHWLELSERAQDERLKKLYKDVADIVEVQKDVVRLNVDLKPESKVGQETLENEAQTNVLTRLERFKQWAKENLGVMSAFTIAVASLVTTIIVATKGSVIRMGKLARDVGQKGGSFAKAVGKFFGALAPVVSAVIGLMTKILSLVGKGLLFLGNNIWILFLFVAYALYEWYIRRERS